MRTKLIAGDRFSRLTFVVKDSAPRKAIFRCDCGIEKAYFVSNVTTGKTRSCGCLDREMKIERSTKHGAAPRGNHTRAYNTWGNMIGRCTKPYREDYVRYGGRGITVCERWKSFENFLADMGEPPEGRSLDRIDNDGNYEPGNCRWATATEQANNRRSNVLIEFRGKTQNIDAWAKELGFSSHVIEDRIRRGASDPAEMFAPMRTIRLISHNGKSQTVAQWAKELGATISGINKRLRLGRPIDGTPIPRMVKNE